MRKIFVVTAISVVLVFILFGCSEPAYNGQAPDEGPIVFLELEDIRAESAPVEQAIADLTKMEKGTITSHYQGTLAFGNVVGYINEFVKLADDKYYITSTAINKDGSKGAVNSGVGSEYNIFAEIVSSVGFEELLNITEKLEIRKENKEMLFTYYYIPPMAESAPNELNFIEKEFYIFYRINSMGNLTDREIYAKYEINKGQEHYDFSKINVSD